MEILNEKPKDKHQRHFPWPYLPRVAKCVDSTAYMSSNRDFRTGGTCRSRGPPWRLVPITELLIATRCESPSILATEKALLVKHKFECYLLLSKTPLVFDKVDVHSQEALWPV